VTKHCRKFAQCIGSCQQLLSYLSSTGLIVKSLSRQTGMHLENYKPLLQQDRGDFLALNNGKVTFSLIHGVKTVNFV